MQRSPVCHDLPDCSSFLDPQYALTVFLINLRNMLMSLYTSSDFKDASLAHSIGIGSLLTDESYGVYLSEKLKTDTITVPWMHGNNLVGYVAWISALSLEQL